MTHEILEALQTYLNNISHGLAHFLPRLITAVLLLVTGWLLALALRALTRLVLRWVRFNTLMEHAGASEFLEKARLGAPDRVAGSVVFWIAWLALLLFALRTLGLVEIDALIQDFVRYLPKLGSALLVVVVGVFLSNFAWRAVLLAAVNARVRGAKVLGALVRAVTLIAASAMALEQLAIGQSVILTAFAISFGAIMLALAIAFGLGGRHLARRYLEAHLNVRPEREDELRSDSPSHL
jgi:hypothetical protein